MSKPATSRGWICALCVVPVLVVIAVTVLAFSPARHGRAHSAATVAPKPAAVTLTARGRVQASYAALPLSFEANRGQTDSQVKYMARGDGYILFLTANDAVFSLQPRSSQKAKSSHRAHKDSNAVVHMQLQGGNSMAKVSASNQLPGKSNYFLGNDPSKWHADVPHYARVSYQDVYPGVNLAFHRAQRQTEFDFVVAPGANPAPIGFRFTGAQGIKTDDSDNLIISSAAGDVQLHKPVAYQEQNGARQAVDARFVLKANNEISFELGNYDHSRELVIDPSVAVTYASYLGGTGNDAGYAIAFDNSGAAYVTGQTSSPNFPKTNSSSLLGTANAFVTKVAPDGTTLDYSTYIGGTGSTGDSGNAIAVNPTSGVVFIAGGTSSSNFPVTSGVFQSSLKGTINAFVLELNSSGVVTHSTYLGGTGSDEALGIALAASGDVIVGGRTSSSDFPLSAAPLQAHVSGSAESGFVTKLNSTFTSPLVYSTYLGGSSNNDLVSAVAIDSSDNVYVTGQTFSMSFPTKNPFQANCKSCTNGNSNAFVAEINPNGSAFVYSTYLGGSSVDGGNSIAVDSAGNAYVTGSATSTDFPVSSAPYQGTNKGLSDVFVTKLNSGGSALGYSTFIGGTGVDAGAAIALDTNNNAYVTGQTGSSDFPATANATQPTYKNGTSDAFVAELNSSGSQLLFSTFLGGTGEEDPGDLGGIAVDTDGANIYVTGSTTSTDFPSTSGVFQGSAGGGTGNTDAFVVKYSQPTSPSFSLSATAFTPSTVSPGGMATSTVSVIPNNGFSISTAVSLACSVSPVVTKGPTCSVSSTATASSPGTLTVSTTGATALLQNPAKDHSSRLFFAIFMPIGGIALLGFGSAGPKRRKLVGFLILGLILSSLILLPACGGGSGGGGGGSSGTPAGTYTVTVTSTTAGASGANPTPMVTVN